MSKLLVTGASGHLGQWVLQHLIQTEKVPASQIIATTRNVSKLSQWAAQGVEIRTADFENVDSLKDAFAGASRMLLISTDGIGRRFAQHKNAIDAAQAVGIKHVVYTSMINPENSLVSFAPEHLATEQALANSEMSWTILRNAWYFENILHSISEWSATGQAYSAAGDGKLAHIAREDLGRAAATVLASERSDKQIFNLTGSQAMSTSDIVHQVAQAIGKPINRIAISVEQAEQGAIQAGLPVEVAKMYASFDANIASGSFSEVSSDFTQLTGRTPVLFTDWLLSQKSALQG